MIEFSKGGHKAPDVMALNPRGQVPTFVDDDGTIVNESQAAVLYLDARYKGQGATLVPDACVGPVLQRVFEAGNLHSAMRDCIYPKMRNIAVPDAEMATRLDTLRGELARWDAYVAASPSDWLASPDFSAADVTVGPLLLAIQRFGATLDATPALKAYAGRVAARPSVAAAWPPHWKEGEGPGYLKEV
jgi:glutathione S-transferase